MATKPPSYLKRASLSDRIDSLHDPFHGVVLLVEATPILRMIPKLIPEELAGSSEELALLLGITQESPQVS
jgi:hypothetical protein